MDARIRVGDVIAGEYEVTAMVRHDSVYEWVKALPVCKSGAIEVQLQMLVPGTFSGQQMKTVTDYFDRLVTIRQKTILVPDTIVSDTDHPLILVYPIHNVSPLEKSLGKSPKDNLKWWEKARELLWVLHNKNMAHGLVSPDCFYVRDGDGEDELCLTNFGYAPVIAAGYKEILKEHGNILSPESVSKQIVGVSSDIYSFAKTLAFYNPQILNMKWYKQCLEYDPVKRFRHMREALSALIKEISEPPKSGRTEEKPPHESGQPVPTKGSIVLKLSLNISIEPPEGGTVSGSGKYVKDDRATVAATATEGWRFDHWSGDLTGTTNPADVKMDSTKMVVVHFVRAKPETVMYRLNIAVMPTDSGKVTGGGLYPEGETVQIIALPEESWQFIHWSGDFSSTKNPDTVVINANKTIAANFLLKAKKVDTQRSSSGRIIYIDEPLSPIWSPPEKKPEPLKEETGAATPKVEINPIFYKNKKPIGESTGKTEDRDSTPKKGKPLLGGAFDSFKKTDS